MEQHPVPQNVTTFQFRLIGDMTIKQFGFLAIGAILAYISYKLPLPLFLNWVLAGAFGLGGFGFAFVPVEERPMDVWFFSFLKSVYSPTQFLWQKSLPTSEARQSAVAASSATPPPVSPPHKIEPVPVINPIPQTPLISNINPVVILEDKIKTLTNEKSVTEANEEKFVLLQKQLQDAVSDRQRLEQELINLKRRIAPPLSNFPPQNYPGKPMPQGFIPTTVPVPSVPQSQPTVGPANLPPGAHMVPPATAQSVGLPKLTTFANVVTGIIKDHDGNLMPGILITVRNPDGIPLRALKTNKLGQFGASTPLPNGSFIVEAEDPRGQYVFEKASLTLKGEVMPPIEITAKSQKEIDRSKLAKQIFGNQT